jgi:hypothetical protein
MRNKNWLRYGLASTMLACGALSAVLIACGDDDSGVTANTPDSGGTDGNNNNTPDTGGGDTGTDSSPPGPTPAKIVLVHAATDYGPNNPSGIVRVCYATKTATDTDFSISPLDPLPHTKAPDSQLPFPGIPIGAGGPFPSTGIPLESFSIRPYIISAAALAARGITGKEPLTPKCNQILKSGFVPDGGFAGDASAPALTENTDYWKLGDIPTGTFKNGKTYLLSVTGCTSDASSANFGATGKCGPDPAGDGGTPYQPTNSAGTGNLKIAVLEIDATTTVASDEMGVQVVHLSPQYQIARTVSVGTAVRPFQPVFGSPFAQAVTPDAGYDAASTVKVGSSEISFNPNGSITAIAKLKGIVDSTGYFAAHEDDFTSEGPFIPIQLNNAGFPIDAGAGLVTIQYLSEGKNVPDQNKAYVNGKTYTFVLVGDPQGSGLRKIHFLAFPNVFTPPKSSD